MTPRRFPYRAGPGARPPRSPQHVRFDWTAALQIAGDLALAAERGDETAQDGFGPQAARLAMIVRDLSPDSFPVKGVSAAAAAGAWLQLTRSFAHPATAPQTRTACAAFLLAGTRCLDAMLAELRAHEAESWLGRYGRED